MNYAMDNWSLMQDWHLVLPPSRPSALQLSRITNQIIDLNHTKPVAVLGSTPEFRDLLFECGYKSVFVFDRNPNFYKRMNACRIYDSPETLVVGNWLDTLPNYSNTFSVILSDLTSGNIPYEDRAVFYDFISHSLVNGGLFIDKVLTHPGPHLPFDHLVSKYSDLPFNLLHINNFSSEMLFCSDLLNLHQLVDSSLFYELIKKNVSNRRVLAFANAAQQITPPGCIWWYGIKWDQLKEDYCPHLELRGCFDDEPSSPYWGRLKFMEFARGD